MDFELFDFCLFVCLLTFWTITLGVSVLFLLIFRGFFFSLFISTTVLKVKVCCGLPCFCCWFWFGLVFTSNCITVFLPALCRFVVAYTSFFVFPHVFSSYILCQLHTKKIPAQECLKFRNASLPFFVDTGKNTRFSSNTRTHTHTHARTHAHTHAHTPRMLAVFWFFGGSIQT